MDAVMDFKPMKSFENRYNALMFGSVVNWTREWGLDCYALAGV